MDISKIDPYVVNILKENGWYPGRVYNISFWLEVLSGEGYVSFEYAEEILKELGGIYVNVGGDKEHLSAQFNFDALGAGSGEFDRLHDLEIIAGEKLYPIGEMVQAFAYVGESKKIYWGDKRDFILAGNSIEDYLNYLFDRNAKSIKLTSSPQFVQSSGSAPMPQPNQERTDNSAEFPVGRWEIRFAERDREDPTGWTWIFHLLSLMENGRAHYVYKAQRTGIITAIYQGQYSRDENESNLFTIDLRRLYLHTGDDTQDYEANEADKRHLVLSINPEQPYPPIFRARIALIEGDILFPGQELNRPYWFVKLDKGANIVPDQNTSLL